MKAWICIVTLFAGNLVAAERPARDPKAVEEAVALQVFLDRANFGPGKIDGHFGDFTKKALERYRQARGDGSFTAASPARQEPAATSTSSAPPPATSRSSNEPARTSDASATAGLPEPSPLVSSEHQPSAGKRASRDTGEKTSAQEREEKQKKTDVKVDVSDLDLASIAPVFTEYAVTDADVQAVGELPRKPAEMAKLKWLPYASVAEAVAERFHMDVDFLEELNPGKTKNLRAGDVVKVPNVEPFELSSVKDLKPGAAMSGKGANAEETGEFASEEGKDKDKKQEKGEKKAENAGAAPALSMIVSKDDNMLEVLDRGRMIAAFPVTVGSEETASPIGEWKVKGVAKLPEFRYDEKMLKQGERGSEFHLLPPGPNSPVGVVWIALNKKGVGIHGSDSPDAIGRNVSHGCIRLANWDVVKVASMVKGGVPVTIR